MLNGNLKTFSIVSVFRMFPTVLWNGRHLSKDTVIHGYQIPKGVSKFSLSKLFLKMQSTIFPK